MRTSFVFLFVVVSHRPPSIFVRQSIVKILSSIDWLSTKPGVVRRSGAHQFSKTVRCHQAFLIVRSKQNEESGILRYSSQQARSFVQNDNTSLALSRCCWRLPWDDQPLNRMDDRMIEACTHRALLDSQSKTLLRPKRLKHIAPCDVATACWRLAWDDKHLTFSLQIHLDALFDLSWFLTVQYAPERLTPFVPHWFNVRITKDNISKLLEQWRICMFKSKVNNLRSLICSRRDTCRKQYFCPKIKIQSSWKNWR